ncbi:hypothetical protein CLOP_g1831 [Closterium sp. NIES-67]|nr:hypothetical protein CLOP_g1831 [Closterium sp. NIES-67]
MVIRSRPRGEPGTERIWVPSYLLLCELLIQKVHDAKGHFGVDKTLKPLQQFCYWPDMISDVQKYVGACLTCETMKSSRQRSAGLLQPLEPPQRPWQHVTMDFVTGLPARPSGNNAVLVVVRLHGIPAAIISDRDPKFTSRFWQDTWSRYGTRLQFSAANHPQTDG